MEAFESFVALALEDEGLVVSESVKFPARPPTSRREAKSQSCCRLSWQRQLVKWEPDTARAQTAPSLPLISAGAHIGHRDAARRPRRGRSWLPQISDDAVFTGFTVLLLAYLAIGISTALPGWFRVAYLGTLFVVSVALFTRNAFSAHKA
jgi:hypothetical protein